MIERLLTAVFFATVCTVTSAADTYRWEDEKGNVHYSDEFPPTGARNVRHTRQQGAEPEQALPYRLQVVVAKFPVTLYVTDCGAPCDKARQLLLRRGVPHTLLDASSAEVQEALTAITGGELEVPVATIGSTVLRGYEENMWNGALDAAGYPSYAMIEVTPDKPQPPAQAVSEDSENGEVAATDGEELDLGETETPESDTAGLDTDELEDVDAEPADVEENQ
jgi:hypothetical protein